MMEADHFANAGKPICTCKTMGICQDEAIADLYRKFEAERAKVQKLREALQFYASGKHLLKEPQSHILMDIYGDVDEIASNIYVERGVKAEKALAETEDSGQSQNLSLNPDLYKAIDWQPIETAPRNGSRILLAADWTNELKVKQVAYGHWYKLGNRWAYDGYQFGNPECQPTHWMPLPPPPATKEGA